MDPGIRLKSSKGRWELHATVAELQWIVNAYTLTLAGLILLGGSLGDRYGRRRVFVLGAIWFAVASALCATAVDVQMLIAARALEGIGGALLTPGSLAIIQASYVQEDRAKAVGAWSGFGGIAGAIGPFLGGWLVSAAGWRWVFLINLPLAAVVVAVIVAAVLGVACGAGFVLTERERTRTGNPEALVPLDVFASKEFTAVNLVTFVVYGGMGVVFFLFVVALQVVAGYSPIAAGASMVPITLLMLLLSARAGALAQKIGPRIPMTAGLVVVTTGMVLMTRIGPHTSYLTDVLPAVMVFALGLSAVVAPLTATVLATADVRHAGVASGVNNAVARAASLLFVAAIPPLAGLTGDVQSHPLVFLHGFRIAILASAALVA